MLEFQSSTTFDHDAYSGVGVGWGERCIGDCAPTCDRVQKCLKLAEQSSMEFGAGLKETVESLSPRHMMDVICWVIVNTRFSV